MVILVLTLCLGSWHFWSGKTPSHTNVAGFSEILKVICIVLPLQWVTVTLCKPVALSTFFIVSFSLTNSHCVVDVIILSVLVTDGIKENVLSAGVEYWLWDSVPEDEMLVFEDVTRDEVLPRVEDWEVSVLVIFDVIFSVLLETVLLSVVSALEDGVLLLDDDWTVAWESVMLAVEWVTWIESPDSLKEEI